LLKYIIRYLFRAGGVSLSFYLKVKVAEDLISLILKTALSGQRMQGNIFRKKSWL